MTGGNGEPMKAVTAPVVLLCAALLGVGCTTAPSEDSEGSDQPTDVATDRPVDPGPVSPEPEEVSAFAISVRAELEGVDSLRVHVTDPAPVAPGATTSHEIRIDAFEDVVVGDPRFTKRAQDAEGTIFTAGYTSGWAVDADGQPQPEFTADEREVVLDAGTSHTDSITVYTRLGDAELTSGTYVIEESLAEGVIRLTYSVDELAGQPAPTVPRGEAIEHRVVLNEPEQFGGRVEVVEVARTEDELLRVWERFSLEGQPPPMDWEAEWAVFAGPGGLGPCDEPVVQHVRAEEPGRISVQVDVVRADACVDSEEAFNIVIALDREHLPAEVLEVELHVDGALQAETQATPE